MSALRFLFTWRPLPHKNQGLELRQFELKLVIDQILRQRVYDTRTNPRWTIAQGKFDVLANVLGNKRQGAGFRIRLKNLVRTYIPQLRGGCNGSYL